MVEAIM
jgi:hypothetical protein